MSTLLRPFMVLLSGTLYHWPHSMLQTAAYVGPKKNHIRCDTPAGLTSADGLYLGQSTDT